MKHQLLARAALIATCLAIGVILFAQTTPAARAASFTVNSPDDTNDGLCDIAHCSLREAILAANASPGADMISFNLNGGGGSTILPNSSGLGELPPLTERVTIDGSTQPGYAGAPLIELDGSLAGASATGLYASAGAATIRALIIDSFSSSGVHVATYAAPGVFVQDSYIGTDASGTAAKANGRGVFAETGGHVEISDSLISGNVEGILLYSASGGITTSGIVTASKVGTDVTGATAVPNIVGIDIYGNASFGITSNVISGNATGVQMTSNSSLKPIGHVNGNYVGTDAAGVVAIPNGTGISAGGGLAVIGFNVISGNTGAGIDTNGPGARTQVLFNLIGVNAVQTAPLPNGNGIDLIGVSSVSDNAQAGILGNVIAGNAGNGITAAGQYHAVINNKIGVLNDGSAMTNGGYGVYAKAFDSRIQGNTIAHNGAAGVLVDAATTPPGAAGPAGQQVAVIDNSIFDNGGGGIVLVNGANGNVSPPIITSADSSGVSGTGCASCTIQLFTDAANQGRNFHGEVTANGSGIWHFPFPLAGRITATQSAFVLPLSWNSSAFTSHVVRAGLDADVDGFDDAADNCPGFYGPLTTNHDEIVVLSPLKDYNDITRANSDGMGDPCDPDDDNDGRSDIDEVGGTNCPPFSSTSDPLKPDTDGDNVLDGAECALGGFVGNPAYAPTNAQCGPSTDADGDGILGYREVCFYNTDPLNSNTDGDACSDGKEVASVNGNQSVDVIDLQQVASEAGSYSFPGSFVKVDFDVTKNGSIDVIDLAFVAAHAGPCP